MKLKRHIAAGGGNLSQDYQLLDLILKSHYKQKNKWRRAINLI